MAVPEKGAGIIGCRKLVLRGSYRFRYGAEIDLVSEYICFSGESGVVQVLKKV